MVPLNVYDESALYILTQFAYILLCFMNYWRSLPSSVHSVLFGHTACIINKRSTKNKKMFTCRLWLFPSFSHWDKDLSSSPGFNEEREEMVETFISVSSSGQRMKTKFNPTACQFALLPFCCRKTNTSENKSCPISYYETFSQLKIIRRLKCSIIALIPDDAIISDNFVNGWECQFFYGFYN